MARPSRGIRRARKGVESAKQKAANVKRKAKSDARRADRAIANQTIPIENEARLTTKEARLLASELGISRERAKGVIKNANQTLERAQEAGTLSALDADGDGDTDLLDSLEREFQSGSAERAALSDTRQADPPDSLDRMMESSGSLGFEPTGSAPEMPDPTKPVLDDDDLLL